MTMKDHACGHVSKVDARKRGAPVDHANGRLGASSGAVADGDGTKATDDKEVSAALDTPPPQHTKRGEEESRERAERGTLTSHIPPPKWQQIN